MRLDDACSILGCDKRCTVEDAQKKYRKLALTHHPDRCPDDPGATQKFQTLGEAWSRFQRWKSDGFDDPMADDSWSESPTMDPRKSSWWSSSGFPSWFGGGGGYHAEPQRCGANCDCTFCRVQRKRDERQVKAEAEAAAKAAAAARRWQDGIDEKKAAQNEWREKNKHEKAMAAEAAEQAARAKADGIARAAAEASAAAERERAEAAERKRQHESRAKALRKARARLRGLCEKNELADEASVARLCSLLESEHLTRLCDGLDGAVSLAAGSNVEAAASSATLPPGLQMPPGLQTESRASAESSAKSRAAELLLEAESACREEEARVAEAAAAAAAASLAAGASRAAWTDDELSLLVKASNKFPGGVPDRWQRVAEFVNHFASPSHDRSADEITSKVKERRRENDVRLAREAAARDRQEGRAPPVPLAQPPAKPPPAKPPPAKPAASMPANARQAGDTSTPTPAPVPPPIAAATTPRPRATTSIDETPRSSATPVTAVTAALEWSDEQQRMLEGALKHFPASVGATRWDRIAERVPGRTRAECVARYKSIVAALKAKKEGRSGPVVAVE